MVAVPPIVLMIRTTKPGTRRCDRRGICLPSTASCGTLSRVNSDPGLVARADFRMAEDSVP